MLAKRGCHRLFQSGPEATTQLHLLSAFAVYVLGQAPAPAPPAGSNVAAQRPPPIGLPPPVGAAPRPPAPAPAPAAAAPAQQLSRGQLMEGIKQMLRALEDPDKLPVVRALLRALRSSALRTLPAAAPLVSFKHLVSRAAEVE